MKPQHALGHLIVSINNENKAGLSAGLSAALMQRRMSLDPTLLGFIAVILLAQHE